MKSKNDIKHTLLTRILHLIHLIAMATLILTGFYIYAPLSFNIFPNMDIARFLHFVFMYVIIATMIFKLYYSIAIDDFKNLLFTYQDLKDLPGVIKYYVLGIFKQKVRKKTGKYNAGQKLLYTAWPLLLGFQAVTGFAMYFPDAFPGFIYYFGGLNHFKAWHAIGAWIFTISTVAHVYLGTTGPTILDFYKQMITGFEKEYKSG